MSTVATQRDFASDEQWQYTTLGQVAQVKGGKRLPKGEKFADMATSFPYLRVTDFANFSIDTSDLRYLTPEIRATIERYTISKNDVYISIAGSIGFTGMIPEQLDGANLTENAAKLVLNADIIEPRFLMYYLASEVAQKEIRGQTVKNAQPKLALARIASLEIPVPPKTEQRKIAAVLGLVQRAIEQQERLIALTTEVKKALLHKLFTVGLRGEPQKQTEIGPVPESWEVNRLGDHCASSAFGPRFSSNLYAPDGNVVTLRTTDLDDDGNIDYRETPKAQLEIEKFESHLLQRDDVVVSRSGTCGIAAVFEGYGMPVLPGAFLIRLRLADRLRPQFLRYYINSPVGHPRIMKLAQGAIQKNISGTALKNFSVPVPRVEEQLEIEAHAKVIDQKLRIHTQKKLTLSDLFRTLLHQLMTAQFRVNDLDLDDLLQRSIVGNGRDRSLHDGAPIA